ncbi:MULTISPECIES: TetR/AcrR family transcriptional regulator [unclassified Paenibacillus]|uniref:TetR/AcrR family transcriptional regulator n=1 Tax=unclassified Paenibacillus TaxID=185978 RepID=UPI00097040AF|nr:MULTISPECIES: TetR/AcrR family transcriptional regulator [unclassified Paenibacillus]ASS69134.1 TetR/AcrR family transcriptional regulator [Paenibacillus sp. RUD330]
MMTKRGRPRDPAIQKSILAASYDLLLKDGFKGVTMEKIAEQAGVSKVTVYKWWPNKAAVVMDGFLDAATDRLPVPDTGRVIDDIKIHASNLCRFMTGHEGKMIAALIGEGQEDKVLMEAIRSRYIQPRRMEAIEILRKGRERKELREGAELGLCVDLLYGPLLYRMLVTGEPLHEEFVRQLVDSAFRGLMPPQ